MYATLVACDGPERPFDHRVHALYWRDAAGGLPPLPIARLPRIAVGPALLGLLLPGVGRSVARLASLIRRERPAAVVAHGGLTVGSVAPAALLAPRPAYVLKNVTRDSYWLGSGLAAPGRWRLSRFDGVVFYNDDARRDFISTHGWEPPQAAVIPNGRPVSPEAPFELRATVRGELGVPTAALLVAWVGALAPEKDPLAALRALAGLVNAGVEARLVLAGDGPLAAAVDQELRALGLTGRASRLGARADVERLLAAADVALATSRVESVSGVLIEAGLAGRPAVCFDTGDEVVVDGETGFVVPRGDSGALVARLRELALDPARRALMGEAARRRCVLRYDAVRSARLWDEFLLRVVAAPRARRRWSV